MTCIVLTPEGESDVKQIKKLLIKRGYDELTLSKSSIIRKALNSYVKVLRGEENYE